MEQTQNPELRIVHADDDRTLRFLISCYLERNEKKEVFPTGYTLKLYAGETGLQLIELVKKYDPHIIITDNNMPQKNGVTALQEMYEQNILTPNKKAIVTTGLLDAAKSNAKDLEGKVTFIAKPFLPSDLHKAIQTTYPQYFPIAS